MGKMADKLKTVFRRSSARTVHPKQIDRWEGEGGAMPPEPDEQSDSRNDEGSQRDS